MTLPATKSPKTWLIVGLALAAIIFGACTPTAPDTGIPPTALAGGGEVDQPTTNPEPSPTAGFTAGMPSETPGAAGAEVSFSKDVLPILKTSCINCHGGTRTEEGLKLNSYANLIAGSENGPVVIAGDGANSRLVELIATGEMPKRKEALSAETVQLIIDWIDQGALDN
ncbi:MAG: hypothetical protein FJZ96_06330 [Chloroflexi bacterium]|nr:hypothetical protein [Chloroflexota bacterium]